ncbi:MAG: DNA repair protein RecN [Armatimonadetes bacterium]|nr:DNA repair protein RecN [Armatimonadota bacterium]
MLLELRIHNFALIKAAEIAPGGGFNVLTGETGAGKSILIQALGLLIGERAASEQVGSAHSRAVIEGAFDLSDNARAREFLEENGVESGEDALIIAREVEASGRSRVRLNGRLATASVLRDLGELLVDFHGQHENQKLLHAEAHLGFLDAFGDKRHLELRQKTREAFRIWRETERRLAELSGHEQERAQRLDMLQFQAGEIANAKLEADEDETLNEERSRLMNAEKLRSSAAECLQLLFGDEEIGALGMARQSLKSAREIENTDSAVSEWVERLQSAILELEDAAAAARDYAESLEADPSRLEQIESRLFKIGRLKRKYGASVEEILAYRAQIEAEIQGLSLSDEEIQSLKDEAAQKRTEFFQIAEELSSGRQKLAKVFAGEVVKQLSGLAMDKARFELGFERLENGSGDGLDKVEFLFSANPGQGLRPLAKIASGGEISRVMLGLRSVLRDRGDGGGAPVVVFDEIDAGIGGQTAEKVGEKLQEIARGRQVFCITHLPQIAKRADHHWRVEKSAGEDFTSVSINAQSGEERVSELARMMGSESKANLEHARTLLNGAGEKPAKRGKK